MRQFFLLFILSFTLHLSAQDWRVPTDVNYENDDDYRAQQDDIVAAVDYLMQTPLNKNPHKRKMVNAYLLKWLTGTPTVTLTLHSELASYGECSDCLLLYMGAYAKHHMANPDAPTSELNFLAVNDVITFYEANCDAIGKQKPVEKMIKMKKKGKLREWVEEIGE